MTLPGWTPISPRTRAFLDDYDAAGRAPGGDLGAVFADTFLALDPSHAVSLTPAMLAAALPARRRLFDDAGVGELRRADARELRLDDRHRLVRAEWVALADGREVRLVSTLLVRDAEIVVYLNHTDPREALA